MPKPPKPKSLVDQFTDLADQVLGPMEAALTPEPSPVQSRGAVPDKASPSSGTASPGIGGYIDAESTWSTANQNQWAVTAAGEWHNFPSDSLRANCGQEFRSTEISDRKILEHGRRIVACTSCIIAVSRG